VGSQEAGSMTPTPEQLAAIRSNLFRGARWILDEQPDFPWHRDRSKQPTAGKKRSSQALALDLFATIERLQSRNAIVNAWCELLELPIDVNWQLEAEHLVAPELLGELRSSQLDAVAWGEQHLIVWEAKFTEQDGGGCSQVVPQGEGANEGLVQCNGRYERQVNPVNGREARCVLTGKGIRYWDHIPRLLGVSADEDHAPCPYRGGTYQWMRNVLGADALARAHTKRAAFVLLHAGKGFPMASHLGQESAWASISTAATQSGLPVRVVTYMELLVHAVRAANHAESAIVEELAAWIDHK